MAKEKWKYNLSTTEPYNHIGLVKVRQTNTLEFFEFRILENNIPVDLTGYEVFFCTIFDHFPVEQRAEIINPKQGYITYTMNEHDMQKANELQPAYFKLVKDGKYINSTQTFHYHIIKSIEQSCADGEMYIVRLEELIKLYEEYENSQAQSWEEFVESNKEILESIDPGGSILSELISSRKPSGRVVGYGSLPERLDKQIGLDGDFRGFETEISFMGRVQKEFEEQRASLSWFEPAGDGVADDSQSFIDLFDFVAANNIREVLIPPAKPGGFYKITKPLELFKIHSSLKFVASGDRSIIDLVSPTNRGHLFGILGDSEEEQDWIKDIIFENVSMRVSYPKSDYPEGVDNAVGISKAKNITIKNCKVNGSPWKGISAQYFVKNITVENTEASNTYKYGIGTEFSTVEHVTIKNCVTKNNGEQGIFVTSAGDGGYVRNVLIENCVAAENKLEGISLNYCDTPVTKGNQTFDNKSNGIKYRFCIRTRSQFDKAVSNDLAGLYFLNGSLNIVSNADSRNNSLNDPNERGNYFFENSIDCQLINSVGNSGTRSLTNFSENLFVCGSMLQGTAKLPLKTDIATQTERSALHTDGTVEVRHGNIPTLGSWRRGDIVWTTTPFQGTAPGWVCVANGSPGTWKTMATLSV